MEHRMIRRKFCMATGAEGGERQGSRGRKRSVHARLISHVKGFAFLILKAMEKH